MRITSFLIIISYLISLTVCLECNVNNCETCYGADNHCAKCKSGYYVHLDQIEDFPDAEKSIGCIEVDNCPTYYHSIMNLLVITIDTFTVKDSILCINSGIY